MKLLPYLYAVATDPEAKVNGNLRRSDLIAWIYGQAFVAIIAGRPTLLRFKDCDAWVEAPGAAQQRTGFHADTADTAYRAVLCDTDLALVLHLDPTVRGPAAYRVTEPDVWSDEVSHPREALIDILPAGLLDPSNADRVAATLAAWAK